MVYEMVMVIDALWTLIFVYSSVTKIITINVVGRRLLRR